MITINIYDNNVDDIQGTTIVEILPGEGNTSEWDAAFGKLEKLAKSGNPTIFRIDYFDEDGLVSVVIRFWLKYADTIFVETSIPWIRKLLELVHGEEITFTDDIDR